MHLRPTALVALALVAGACGETSIQIPSATCAPGEEERRVRYSTATAAPGARCVLEEQTRTCDHAGTWSDWSGSFAFETCKAADARACQDPAAAHGASEQRTAFAAASVPFGQTCQSEAQTRTCQNGVWSAWSGTFTHVACTVGDPRPCTGPDADHGQQEQRTRFAAASVPFGQTCQSELQTRTCQDGAWSAWSGTFTHEACTVGEPRSCTGPDADHGQKEQRTRFAAASVPFGQTCQSELQTRTCQDGTWSAWSGTFTQPACAVTPPLPCRSPDGAHGATDERTVYASATVPFGQTCQSEVQTRTCHNGVWSAWSGTFVSPTCTAPRLTAIRIVPSQPVLELKGPSLALKVMGSLDTGGEADVTSLTTWATAQPSLVEVLPSGVARGLALGTTRITAQAGGLTAGVDAVVRAWSRQTLGPVGFLELDFSGDGAAAMLAGWSAAGATAGSEVVKTGTWQGAWGTAATVHEEADEVWSVRVALNQRGDRHVLWQVPNPGAGASLCHLRARHSYYGTPTVWADATTLNSAALPNPPAIALSHVGHALATWLESDRQHYSRFAVQGGWLTPGLGVGGRRSFSVAVDPLGNGIVLASDTWLSPTVGSGIYAYHYSRATESVGAPATVHETANAGGLGPFEKVEAPVRLGMDAYGNAVVVWVRTIGSASALMAARYVKGTGWQPAQVVLDAGDAQILLGNLSVHAAGSAVVAFSSNYGLNGHRLFAANYDPSTGWRTPTPLTPAGTNVMVPVLVESESVAAGFDGRALAVWSEQGTPNVLRASRYEPEAGWLPASSIDQAASFSHQSAFPLLDGFVVGYVAYSSSGSATISSAAFR